MIFWEVIEHLLYFLIKTIFQLLTFFLTLPPGKTRCPFYRRLGGPLGRSGGAENLVPTGIRSPDRSARKSVPIPTELPVPLFQCVFNSISIVFLSL